MTEAAKTARSVGRVVAPAAREPWLAFLLAVLLIAGGCGSNPDVAPGGQPLKSRDEPRAGARPSAKQDAIDENKPAPAAAEPSPFLFTEITATSGIDFVHDSGMTAEKQFPTANGAGVALFDADGDGDLDLYFANGCRLPVGSAPSGPNRFYRNLGGGQFEDATTGSGLGFKGYCHGVIIGDIDNDGDADVFLANFGPDALFLNNGDGTFRDISAAALPARALNWSSSAAFLDYDNDGDLDLYVTKYGEWVWPRDDRFCGDVEHKIRRYCSPKELKSVRHSLLRNNGDLTFTDVAEQAGLGRADGHGFGVVASDLNADGRIDLYVANDQDPNFTFLNNGDGTFRDATLESGAAFDYRGRTQSGMGVEAEDLDGDGLPELFVTNFQDEYNTLYQNLGEGLFLDATAAWGLGIDSLPWIGWGCAAADFDNDGLPDIFVANGHIDDNASVFGRATGYAEPPLLHLNLGGRFRLANRGSGPYFESNHVGHGVALGDFDNDGDWDLVVSHKDGPPALLRNDSQRRGRWIRLILSGRASNRDAIGARVVVEAGGRSITRQVKGGGSLMSSRDPRLLVGLGKVERVDRVTIRWPSGRISRRGPLELDCDVRVVEDAPSPGTNDARP